MTGILLVCKPCRKVSLAPTNISQSKDLSSSVHSWSSEALHSIPSFVICSSSSWCRSWSPETNLRQRLCLGRCGVDFFDCRPGLSRNGSQTPSWFTGPLHATNCRRYPWKQAPFACAKRQNWKFILGRVPCKRRSTSTALTPRWSQRSCSNSSIVHLWARSDATDATDATWNLKMGLLSSVAATCKERAGLASMAFACLALSISRVWSCSFKEPLPESMAWEGPSFAWWSRHLRMGSPCFSYWLIINNI